MCQCTEPGCRAVINIPSIHNSALYLYQVTSDSKYADRAERIFYNALCTSTRCESLTRQAESRSDSSSSGIMDN